MAESLGKAYRKWVIASVAMLVGSLMLLAAVGTMGFVMYGGGALPLWLVALGVLAAAGVGLGFGGFFVIMMAAGWRSFREARRVQVISPKRTG